MARNRSDGGERARGVIVLSLPLRQLAFIDAESQRRSVRPSTVVEQALSDALRKRGRG